MFLKRYNFTRYLKPFFIFLIWCCCSDDWSWQQYLYAVCALLTPTSVPLSSSWNSCRHEQPWGAGAGGEGLQNALCLGLPRLAPWTHAAVLEARGRREAHLWLPAVLPGGLLHRHGAAVPAWRKPVTAHVWEWHGVIMERRQTPPPPDTDRCTLTVIS